MKMIRLIVLPLILLIGCSKEESKKIQFSEGIYNVQEKTTTVNGGSYSNSINYEIEIVRKTDTSFCILGFPSANNDTVRIGLKRDSLYIPSLKFLLIENDTVYISGNGIIAENNKLIYTYRSGSKLGVFSCACIATKK